MLYLFYVDVFSQLFVLEIHFSNWHLKELFHLDLDQSLHLVYGIKKLTIGIL